TGGEKTQTLVVSMGGYYALQQLLFAKATLFATLYHHHKVRACDCMIKACYEEFRRKDKPFKMSPGFSGIALKSAADFLFLTDSDFCAEAYNHKKNSVEHSLIHDLVFRRLLKRVLTISTHTVK